MLTITELGAYIDRYFTRSLFRLETLDQYEVPTDGNDFARYLAGEAEPTWERKQPWLDHLAAEAAAGRYRHRVHVVRGPLGAYLRYECEWGYAYNVAAGEDVRILDLAEQDDPGGLVEHDFWVIDEARVLRMHYADNAEFVGAEVAEAVLLPAYLAVRDVAWAAAEPFTTYWVAHPQYWRGSGAAGRSTG